MAIEHIRRNLEELPYEIIDENCQVPGLFDCLNNIHKYCYLDFKPNWISYFCNPCDLSSTQRITKTPSIRFTTKIQKNLVPRKWIYAINGDKAIFCGFDGVFSNPDTARVYHAITVLDCMHFDDFIREMKKVTGDINIQPLEKFLKENLNLK